jgi:hypothetical protein
MGGNGILTPPQAAENLIRVLRGKRPLHVVNPDLLADRRTP